MLYEVASEKDEGWKKDVAYLLQTACNPTQLPTHLSREREIHIK
jgi:hypothetical protein